MLSLLLLLACARNDRPTVVLVSLDTTRADAVGAWSGELTWRPDIEAPRRPAPNTPTLDALAAEGTRFSWALAPAPTTLASHVSVFSSLDPYAHGVLRNGAELPAALPVLSERMAAAGYDTLGAVGAAVLAPSSGLDRGFRLYEAPTGGAGRPAERPAPEVTDAALGLVDQRRPDQPLFLFVHYYDPHTPWDQAPPALVQRLGVPGYSGAVDGSTRSFPLLTRLATQRRLTEVEARQARGLYLSEVANADAELGRLLQGLQTRHLLDEALILVMGDHGEVLDDRVQATPFSHGPDVDLVALHVPLLMAARGGADPLVPAGLVVERPVRLLDLAPTLLGLLGLPGLGEGEDLRPLLGGERPEAPPSFAVATQARGLERLPTGPRPGFERSVAWGGQLLVRSPGLRDQLFDLAPGQPALNDPARARALGALLDEFDARAPAGAQPVLPAGVQEQLERLGYVQAGGTAASPAEPESAVSTGSP